MDVKLSQKTFKALANSTRIAILKQLDKRKFTQSELSENLGFAVPTIKQHIFDLEKADLVLVVDEGRKWKYVELTKNGKAILHPEEKKIWILLGTLSVAIIGGIITFVKNSVSQIKVFPEAKMFIEETSITQDAVIFSANRGEIAPTVTKSFFQSPILIYVFIFLAIVSAFSIVFYLIKRNKRLKLLKNIGGNLK